MWGVNRSYVSEFALWLGSQAEIRRSAACLYQASQDKGPGSPEQRQQNGDLAPDLPRKPYPYDVNFPSA